ncbi:hypothetical protein TNCV_515871 [Trichonephila clavipes]|nr:hypothetical protein TNCV_515871 [Trichonephila clavipes]
MAHENIKWTETLPAVLLGLRVAVKSDINASSAELVYGVSLRLPGEICTDTSLMPLDYGFDLPDTITDPIISAESSHRHPMTTKMQTTKSGRWHPIREQPLSSQPCQKTLNISHPDEARLPRLPDSIDQPITAMPQSRMNNSTFAKPNIKTIQIRD